MQRSPSRFRTGGRRTGTPRPCSTTASPSPRYADPPPNDEARGSRYATTVAAVLWLSVACNSTTPVSQPWPTTSSPTLAAPTQTPVVTPPPSPSVSCAGSMLDGMSEAQRVGQLLMVGL